MKSSAEPHSPYSKMAPLANRLRRKLVLHASLPFTCIVLNKFFVKMAIYGVGVPRLRTNCRTMFCNTVVSDSTGKLELHALQPKTLVIYQFDERLRKSVTGRRPAAYFFSMRILRRTVFQCFCIKDMEVNIMCVPERNGFLRPQLRHRRVGTSRTRKRTDR